MGLMSVFLNPCFTCCGGDPDGDVDVDECGECDDGGGDVVMDGGDSDCGLAPEFLNDAAWSDGDGGVGMLLRRGEFANSLVVGGEVCAATGLSCGVEPDVDVSGEVGTASDDDDDGGVVDVEFALGLGGGPGMNLKERIFCLMASLSSLLSMEDTTNETSCCWKLRSVKGIINHTQHYTTSHFITPQTRTFPLMILNKLAFQVLQPFFVCGRPVLGLWRDQPSETNHR